MPLPWPSHQRGTHVVQRTPAVTQLNNLHTRQHALEPLVLKPAVPGLLQPFLEVHAAWLLHAEDTGAGLVEALGETDVEVCRVGAQCEVDKGQCGRMAAVDLDGAAGEWPLGAVGNVGCLIDVGALGVLAIDDETQG